MKSLIARLFGRRRRAAAASIAAYRPALARAMAHADAHGARSVILWLPDRMRIEPVPTAMLDNYSAGYFDSRRDRIAELSEANNREVERRRRAEADAANLMDALAPFAEVGKLPLRMGWPVQVVTVGPWGERRHMLTEEHFANAAAAFRGETITP